MKNVILAFFFNVTPFGLIDLRVSSDYRGLATDDN